MENEDKIEWLSEIGTAIYGDHWKSALATHLGVNDRSVRQWANGERTIPDSVIRGLLSLAHDRAAAMMRRADRAALDMSGHPGYERVITSRGCDWMKYAGTCTPKTAPGLISMASCMH